MGYKPKRTLYQLTFEDPDLAGLEVTTRGVSAEGLLGFIDMHETVEQLGLTGTADQAVKPEHVQLLRDFFGRFAKVLVSWNVEDDDDKPVPPTLDGLLTLDLDFIMAVIVQWISGMVQAPPPLPGASPSGGNSPEAPTGLAEASRSLPS